MSVCVSVCTNVRFCVSGARARSCVCECECECECECFRTLVNGSGVCTCVRVCAWLCLKSSVGLQVQHSPISDEYRVTWLQVGGAGAAARAGHAGPPARPHPPAAAARRPPAAGRAQRPARRLPLPAAARGPPGVQGLRLRARPAVSELQVGALRVRGKWVGWSGQMECVGNSCLNRWNHESESFACSDRNLFDISGTTSESHRSVTGGPLRTCGPCLPAAPSRRPRCTRSGLRWTGTAVPCPRWIATAVPCPRWIATVDLCPRRWTETGGLYLPST